MVAKPVQAHPQQRLTVTQIHVLQVVPIIQILSGDAGDSGESQDSGTDLEMNQVLNMNTVALSIYVLLIMKCIFNSRPGRCHREQQTDWNN